MSAGQTKPHMPLDATEDERLLARTNCANVRRERGEHALALEFEAGTQDEGWSMRHEVNRLRAEQAKQPEGAQEA